MKKSIAGILIGIVLLMNIAAAQEATASSEASAEANAISSVDLRLRQIGGAFGDFFFNVRSAFTFDNSAKLELLKERNAELKERQQSWVKLNQEAMSGIESSNLTASQKQKINPAL